jgi:subtilisin-like proprotein convertase family protein
MNATRLLRLHPLSFLSKAIVFTSCVWCLSPAKAVISISEQFFVNQAIPDGSYIGLTDTQLVSTDIIAINEITVSIDILDGFNGDLYAYLSFDGDFAVLLNRSGRTLTNPFGYADEGYNVTFDDAAPNGDIHLYQFTLDPAFSPLTGTWQPSGRDIDPDDAFDTTPRTAWLSSFHGLDPNGNWSLFIADMETGGAATLESWTINITGVIPEPSAFALLAGMLGLSWVMLRRR